MCCKVKAGNQIQLFTAEYMGKFDELDTVPLSIYSFHILKHKMNK